MTATTLPTIDDVIGARKPEDVFGTLEHVPPELRGEVVAEVWRTLNRRYHPDVCDDPRATDAASRLNVLYTAAKVSLAKGTYGQATVVDTVTIQSRRNAYRVTDVITKGSTCTIYAATYDDGKPAILKIVRDRKDGKLIANEAKVLKAMLSNTDTYNALSPYLPEYIETFGYRTSDSKKPRQTVAFAETPNLVTLDEVRERYPAGVHAKDAAWMLRRILFALGWAHRNGYVHGAILPEHVLIEPAHHGVVLIDWKYAVETGQPIGRYAFTAAGVYPQEVLLKEPLGPGTDIYMAMGCFAYVMGGNLDGTVPDAVPRQIRAFIRGSRQDRLSRRPQDALALLGEYNELIERLWGPRKFRPFTM